MGRFGVDKMGCRLSQSSFAIASLAVEATRFVRADATRNAMWFAGKGGSCAERPAATDGSALTFNVAEKETGDLSTSADARAGRDLKSAGRRRGG